MTTNTGTQPQPLLPMERSRHMTEGVAKHPNTSSVQLKCVRWGITMHWPLHWPHMYTWPLWVLAAVVCVEWQAATSMILLDTEEEEEEWVWCCSDRSHTERLTSLSQPWSEPGSAGCSCYRCPTVRKCWHPRRKATPRLSAPESGRSPRRSGTRKPREKLLGVKNNRSNFYTTFFPQLS